MSTVDETPTNKPFDDWEETKTRSMVNKFLLFGEAHGLTVVDHFKKESCTTVALSSSHGTIVLVVDPQENQQYISYESQNGESYLELSRFQGTAEQYTILNNLFE